jgi:hypothetical protein
MSWLEDLERDYKYQCAQGHLSLFRMPNNTPDEVTRADTACPDCGESAKYIGFASIKLGMTGKVLNEQNGRYYYEIRRPDGSISRISKTKWDYINSFDKDENVDPKTGKKACAKITPAYTPAYREHLQKIGRTDLLQESFVNERVRKQDSGKVTPLKEKEAIP